MSKTTSSKRANLAGDQARERILTSAIELFSTHGFAATSIRDITRNAEVNQAAIHYHFGAKRDLFIAAISKYFEVIEARRLEMLDKAEASEPLDLEQVIRAFVDPHIRFASTREGRQYLQMFNHFASTPSDIIQELYKDQFSEVRTRFLAAIKKSEPGISQESLLRGFSFVANNIVSALFDPRYEASTGRKPYQIKVDEFIDLLVAYHTAGFRALG